MKKITIVLTAAVLVVSSLSGCKNSKLSRQEKGAIIGAGAGGAAGAVIGRRSGNTAVGAIIGAAVGGSAGALIGIYMDKQARELEQKVEGAKVERVGEGIKMTFDSGLLFAFDSEKVNNETRGNLDKMAEVLRKYEDTEILIEGHTDGQGTDAYNKRLSNRRAEAVANYLRSANVSKNRLETVGYGENQPVSTNDTEAGRQQNRRVEVVIVANEKLKKEAAQGKTPMSLR
ncbi:OmpA family protein [Telluribacter sp.]|jgi:outer membrane protein OmpA-like peptidoglycan-associated protein|uniref:OmpA family protein n=1 Tax=Telluribacter sp. TaxID=1978767 RepID=UPI002E0E71AA|nr:OmpA family protein [Telluribacter sp.]